MNKPFLSVLGASCLLLTLGTSWGQSLNNIEAAEYESNSDRWLVSNGNSVLVTSDLGDTWSTFGEASANYGMEVLGSHLFVIRNNGIRAYDVVSGEEVGSVNPSGVQFLNGMGSMSSDVGDFLVVSDFQAGRLLKIDVTSPANMTSEVLVANTGTTPNGVTIVDGQAYVVNWGNNADILQVDVATGEITVVVDGSGLGNCDGIDYTNGAFVVSSWSPQRITQFTEGTWEATTLVQGSPLSSPADLSINAAGDMYAVACSGNNTVYFGALAGTSQIESPPVPFGAEAIFEGQRLHLYSPCSGAWHVTGFDLSGRKLGELLHPSSLASTLSLEQLGPWASNAFFLDLQFESSEGSAWRTSLKMPQAH
jgi:hypothetical protein